MGKPPVLFVFLVIFLIVISAADAAIEDLCETCRRVDECPLYGEMSREKQEQWIKSYPCNHPGRVRSETVPGFSAFAKGDFICCPSSKVWGIEDDNVKPATDKETEPHNFYVPKYLWYQNQNTPNQFGRSYVQEQPRILKPTQNQNVFTNNNNGFGLCVPQSLPPKPESGCCGADMSAADRITDVQEFLQRKSQPSYLRPQNNYARYQRDLERQTRDVYDNDLEVTIEDRIAGGRETDLDQYPWATFLSITFLSGFKKQNFICGGSLISSRFVLSAAHCMVSGNDKIDSVDVTLAEYDRRTFPMDCVDGLSSRPICIENMKIPGDKVIIHPEFIEKFLINDIALVRLIKNAPYTRYIRPICLPPINIDSPQFSKLPLATAGWGLNMTVPSNVKQFTVVHMVPKSECKAHYSHLTDGHICASGKNTEDTCKGDSGGPLMMMYQGKYYVAGIVSGKTAAFSCGTPVPSLYTNVYNYLNWIQDNIRNNQ